MYDRMDGQIQSAKKQLDTRSNPRWCSPDDTDMQCEITKLLRLATLGRL